MNILAIGDIFGSCGVDHVKMVLKDILTDEEKNSLAKALKEIYAATVLKKPAPERPMITLILFEKAAKPRITRPRTSAIAIKAIATIAGL